MSIFFTSPIGLGHATRDIAIAEQLKPTCSEILFVSGAAAYILISHKGYQTFNIYNPISFHIEAGRLHQRFRWLMKYISYYKECKNDAKNILIKHDGLIVSDEDFASIAAGAEMNRNRVLITDITETRFTRYLPSIVEREMNKKMRQMMYKCNHVIVPDYGDDKDNFVYVGPIVREVSADRNTLRKRFGFKRKTILLCIGGTNAGEYLIAKSIEAYKKLRKRMDIDLVVVPGPLVKLTDSADYTNAGFVDNLHEYVYASDLVISLAGRSTIDESKVYGTPGIFIPIKNHFEQEESAKRLGYEFEDIFRIENLIEEKLSLQNNEIANTNGVKKAADLILTMLNR